MSKILSSTNKAIIKKFKPQVRGSGKLSSYQNMPVFYQSAGGILTWDANNEAVNAHYASTATPKAKAALKAKQNQLVKQIGNYIDYLEDYLPSDNEDYRQEVISAMKKRKK